MRLYEKFRTGAAVVLYEMGVSAVEQKVRQALNRYRIDKPDVLKLIPWRGLLKAGV